LLRTAVAWASYREGVRVELSDGGYTKLDFQEYSDPELQR
jgi:hypothetical protein